MEEITKSETTKHKVPGVHQYYIIIKPIEQNVFSRIDSVTALSALLCVVLSLPTKNDAIK